MIVCRSAAELERLARVNALVARVLVELAGMIAPGVTTAEVDALAERRLREAGAEPAFKGYHGYPATICASVNEQVVHGIPGDRVLEPGDIVSIDAGAQFAGWNGDSALTVVIPDASRPEVVAERERLSEVTHGSLWAGIARLATASHLGEVGAAIQEHIESQGTYGILRDYVGHGIGRKMHEPPTVFNYATGEREADVRPGLVVAIEPMVVAGDQATFVEDDDWTVTTIDGSAGSHWEHSVAVHDGGIWVLTAHDGGAAGLAPFGVVPVPIP